MPSKDTTVVIVFSWMDQMHLLEAYNFNTCMYCLVEAVVLVEAGFSDSGRSIRCGGRSCLTHPSVNSWHMIIDLIHPNNGNLAPFEMFWPLQRSHFDDSSPPLFPSWYCKQYGRERLQSQWESWDQTNHQDGWQMVSQKWMEGRNSLLTDSFLDSSTVTIEPCLKSIS